MLQCSNPLEPRFSVCALAWREFGLEFPFGICRGRVRTQICIRTLSRLERNSRQQHRGFACTWLQEPCSLVCQRCLSCFLESIHGRYRNLWCAGSRGSRKRGFQVWCLSGWCIGCGCTRGLGWCRRWRIWFGVLRIIDVCKYGSGGHPLRVSPWWGKGCPCPRMQTACWRCAWGKSNSYKLLSFASRFRSLRTELMLFLAMMRCLLISFIANSSTPRLFWTLQTRPNPPFPIT